MDRAQWLREHRLWNEVQMDTLYARTYDERWGGYINTMRQQMVERLLDSRCWIHAAGYARGRRLSPLSDPQGR